MKHLYEVAILMSFTSRQGEKHDSKPTEACTSQVASAWSDIHGVRDQVCTNPRWIQDMSNWRGQNVDTILWSTPAPDRMNASFVDPTWNVENATSVSSLISHSSISSWDRSSDIWISQSRDSINELTPLCSGSGQESTVISRQTGINDIAFASKSAIPVNSLFTETNCSTNAAEHRDEHCPSPDCPHYEKPIRKFHTEDMLSRVAQDLVSLKAQDQVNMWQTSKPGSSEVCAQPIHDGSFSNNGSFMRSEEINQLQSFKEHKVFSISSSASELSDTALRETDLHRSVGLDSGQVSRSSSLSSLLAVSRAASEENLADIESCEDHQIEDRRTKRKVKNSALTCKIFKQPQVPSLNRKRTGTQKGRPITKESITLNVEDCKESIRSTSGYSESLASRSLSSDSEVSELNPYSKPFVPRAYLNLSSASYDPVISRNDKVQDFINSALIWNSSSCNVGQTFNHGSQFWDSGVGNTMNLTQAFNTTSMDGSLPSRSLTDIFSDETLTESNEKLKCSNIFPWPVKFRKEVPRNEPSPYVCKLDHDSEFTPINKLNLFKLPSGYQTSSTLDTILTISQRVVKLRVSKPFKSRGMEGAPVTGQRSDQSTEGPVIDHYGTGFTCHVDTECLVVRTHSELICNPLEASNTEVTFLVTFPGGSQSSAIRCTGMSEGFSSSVHSQTTKFMCKTPPELIPYLPLFSDVPVIRRSTLFNDSCYFSDSSSSERDDEPDQIDAPVDNTLLFTAAAAGISAQSQAPAYRLKKEQLKNQSHSATEVHKTLPGIHSISLPWPSCNQKQLGDLSGALINNRLQQLSKTPFSPLVTMETEYELRGGRSGTSRCPYAGLDVFDGSGAYRHFSSFAGDVFDSFVITCPAASATPEAEHASPRWEYERLVYAQNHFKHLYLNQITSGNTCFNNCESQTRQTAYTFGPLANSFESNLPSKNGQPNTSTSSRKLHNKIIPEIVNDTSRNLPCDPCRKSEVSLSESTSFKNYDRKFKENGHLRSNKGEQFEPMKPTENYERIWFPNLDQAPVSSCDFFAEFCSRDSYLDTWDRDLLNLDEELNPLPELGHMEAMVDNLLEETDDELVTPCCCPGGSWSRKTSGSRSPEPEEDTSFCVIISFPHGGTKMVSTGRFSRHHCVGGMLHDAPTCMGSCGAPVVALTEDVTLPHVTHFVHSGTVRINNASTGAAVAYFDQSLPNFV